MAAAEPVGLEYTIMAVTCFFSQQAGRQAAIWYSCVSQPKTCFRRVRYSARLIGSAGRVPARSGARTRSYGLPHEPWYTFCPDGAALRSLFPHRMLVVLPEVPGSRSTACEPRRCRSEIRKASDKVSDNDFRQCQPERDVPRQCYASELR